MYSVERTIRICDDKTGEIIEVGPDSDGLDMVEVRPKGQVEALRMPKEQAVLVAKAILYLYGEEGHAARLNLDELVPPSMLLEDLDKS